MMSFSIWSRVTVRPAARNVLRSNAPGTCRMLFDGNDVLRRWIG